MHWTLHLQIIDWLWARHDIKLLCQAQRNKDEQGARLQDVLDHAAQLVQLLAVQEELRSILRGIPVVRSQQFLRGENDADMDEKCGLSMFCKKPAACALGNCNGISACKQMAAYPSCLTANVIKSSMSGLKGDNEMSCISWTPLAREHAATGDIPLSCVTNAETHTDVLHLLGN